MLSTCTQNLIHFSMITNSITPRPAYDVNTTVMYIMRCCPFFYLHLYNINVIERQAYCTYKYGEGHRYDHE